MSYGRGASAWVLTLISSWIIVVSQWVLSIGMVPLILRRRRHRPTVALAWLLMVFAVPLIGAILYLMVGEVRLGGRRSRKFTEARRLIETAAHSEMHKPHVVRPKIREDDRDIVRLTERLSNMPVLGGNDVRFIADPGEMIESLVREIDAAAHHVHLLYYIFESDQAGMKVAGALARASARGVVCRVLVDDAGSRFTFTRAERLMREAGVRTQRMLHVSFVRLILARIDIRNHRKLAVIDGTIAYVGSQNIIDPRTGMKRRRRREDLTVRLIGPVVMALQTIFTEDWYAELGEHLEGPDIYPRPLTTTGDSVQIAPSGPGYPTEAFGQLIVAAIHQSNERVTMSTPYLIPDESTLQALCIAALRGVRVEVIVPLESDSRLADAASRAYFDVLMDAGVRVYQHQGGMLHSKTLAVDDSFALVGSGNLDVRSFALNYELSIVLYGPKVTEQLREHQEVYLAGSVALDPEAWNNRPTIRRFFDTLASLISPLL